jgi:hypothetical protein
MDDLDAAIGEDRVGQGRVSAVSVADDVPRRRSGVVEIHGEVAGEVQMTP